MTSPAFLSDDTKLVRLEGTSRKEQLAHQDGLERRLTPIWEGILTALGGVLAPDEQASVHLRRGNLTALLARAQRHTAEVLEEATPKLVEAYSTPVPIRKQFEPLDPVTVEQLAARDIGGLIRGIDAVQLRGVREHLTQVFNRGVTERTLRDIYRTTGLTSRQVRRVHAARALALEQGLTERQAGLFAGKLQRQILRTRAQTIARTESTRFLGHLTWERGNALPKTMKQWVSARDGEEDTAGICRGLDDGRKIANGETFPGGFMYPPAHIACRCFIEIFVVKVPPVPRPTPPPLRVIRPTPVRPRRPKVPSRKPRPAAESIVEPPVERKLGKLYELGPGVEEIDLKLAGEQVRFRVVTADVGLERPVVRVYHAETMELISQGKSKEALIRSVARKWERRAAEAFRETPPTLAEVEKRLARAERRGAGAVQELEAEITTLQHQAANATGKERRTLLRRLSQKVGRAQRVERGATARAYAEELGPANWADDVKVQVRKKPGMAPITELQRKRWEDGAWVFRRMLSKRWLRRRTEFLRISSTPEGASRAYYQRWHKTAFLDQATDRVVVHELGHHLEYAEQKIHNAVRAFYEARTAGETAKPLGIGYDSWEITKRDRFIKPYMGKIYPGERATELVSMGLEWMATRPRELLKGDPELFQLILRIMYGDI